MMKCHFHDTKTAVVCSMVFYNKLHIRFIETIIMDKKQPISTHDLLQLANNLIQSHDAYLDGMYADSVEEKDGVLVFKGNYFLDTQGLPTIHTTTVFNIFKYLATELSKKYTIN